MVDADQKKQWSHNVIFMDGIAHCQIKDTPSTLPFPKQESTHIEEVTKAEAKAEVKAEESRRRHTRSEVWGTDPTRRSDQLAGKNKILATRTQDNVPDIVISQAYSDAIHTPEGKLWKDVMDYELAKLEEMNTWSKINEGDIPQANKFCQECGFTLSRI